MSWGPSSRSMVQCNAPQHMGTGSALIEHGAHVSAVEAVKASGWHYNQRTQTHVCPECAAIDKARGK